MDVDRAAHASRRYEENEMKHDTSATGFFKTFGKALAVAGAVIAIGYPFVGEPAEWLGLIVYAGLMGH
jgi:hypothetical protein